MFTAELYNSQLWKQPKCPSTDKWIKMIVYTYMHTYVHTRVRTHTHTHTIEYHSATIKNEMEFSCDKVG